VGNLWRAAGPLLAVLACAACANPSRTTRIDDAALTTGSISRTQKGIALVKIGAAVNACTTAMVSLGTRDGNRFKAVTTLRVVGLNSPVQPAVAEVELAPGEYHVTGYACITPRNGVVSVASQMHLSGKVESFASFTVHAGEVVNAGFILITPVAVTRVANGAIVNWRIDVRDWPIDEVARFKAQRPQLYAAMQARLMTVTKVPPVTADQIVSACAPHKQLQAEGKIQELPPLCRPGAVLPGVPAAAGPSAPARGLPQPALRPKPKGVDA
jgi:hypothetical protein